MNDNLVGKLFRLHEILSCLLVQVSKIEVLKTSVQFTCDANKLFCTSRASMSSVNEMVNVTSSAFIINSGQQRTVDKLAI